MDCSAVHKGGPEPFGLKQAYDPAMDDAQLAIRLGAIERQLKIVSAQLGVDCPPFVSDVLASESQPTPAGGPTLGNADKSGLPSEVVDLARSGHTTEAISRLRHLTGASLLEAKRAVDALKS
jgi:ribosomal protein L7/L12